MSATPTPLVEPVETSMDIVRLRDLIQPVESRAPNLSTDDFTYIDLSSVDGSSKQISSPRTVAVSEAPSRARQHVRAGDVLVSTVRPNLNGVAIVPDRLNDVIASTGFCVLRANAEVLDSRYLYHWVRSDQFVANMVRRATGASYPAVSDSIVKDSTIPLPPLPEQRRIAAILDQADELCAGRRRAIELLDELLDSAYETTFGCESWAKSRLGDVVERIDGGTSPVCLDRSAEADEWAVLKLSAVTSGVYLPSQNKAIAETFTPRGGDEVLVGDVLLTRKNTLELVGASAYVFETPEKLLLPDLIFRLVPVDGVEPLFIQRQLASSVGRRALRKLASGSAASMSNISKERLRNLVIDVPPISLQRKFVESTHSLQRAKAAHRAHLAKLDELFASLQHSAFTGQL